MGFDLAAARAYQRERDERDLQERERRREVALAATRAVIRAIAPRFPTVRRVYVFGSVTRPGAFRLSSDVDLGVEGDLDPEVYSGLWREIERDLWDWEVDLVELDPDLAFDDIVRERGELIYERTNSGPAS